MGQVRGKFDNISSKVVDETPSVARVKYVKKASQWCRTYFLKGKQIQEWYNTQAEAEKGRETDES